MKKWGGKQNVQVIAVCLGGDDKAKTAAKEFFKQFDMKFPLVMDEGGKIDPLYNINSVPVAFVIDKKGIIREIFLGELSMPADIINCAFDRVK